MTTNRRAFIATGICSVAGLGVSAPRRPTSAGDKEWPKVSYSPPKPPYRLGVDWHRRTIARLQEKLGEKGLDGMVVKDRWNIIYLPGLFHSTTERPFWLFVPTKGEPTFFHPGLDRDLVGGWWVNDHEWYFDYPHSGEFDRLVSKAGKRAELTEWMLKGLQKRGYGKSKLGIEEELSPKVAATWTAALRDAAFVPAGDLLMKMRQVKTPEEIELTQKAIDLHDAMLEFGRSYILMHGAGTTDFEVRHATEAWATETLLPVMKLDGRPHTGVGISLSITCRAGVSTAYPHPNQFFYAPINKGDAVQLSTVIRIGGYGGEGYRALHIEPLNELQRRMWTVHTEMTLLQAELCKAGARCQEIGERVLEHGIKAGMAQYIYHRPAHGAGMEGHQAPYVSLGDETVLEENMMFSNEPGLYNPEGGFGYNHSNNVLVQKQRGQIMNRAPLTKEWCWMKI